jgi:hypothetical protein
MFWYLALIEVYALSKAWRQRVKLLDGRSGKTICDARPHFESRIYTSEPMKSREIAFYGNDQATGFVFSPASLIHPRGLFQARCSPPLG